MALSGFRGACRGCLPRRARLLNSGPVFNAIGVSAIAAIVLGVRKHRPAARWAWYLLALGQALFVLGDVLAYNYKAYVGGEPPFPSIADPVYLAVYPLIVAGLILMTRRRNPGRDWGGLIDALILTIGLGLLSWVFLMAPYAHNSSLHLDAKLVSIAYPMMDILVLGVAVRMAVGAGRRSGACYMLIAAIGTLLVTDSIYGWIQLHSLYAPGDLLDGGWICYYVLLGSAALHPSMATISQAAAPSTRLARPRALAIAAAVLVVPAIEIVKAASGEHSDALVIAVAAAVLFGLVVARMIGMARAQELAAKREAGDRERARLAAVVGSSASAIISLRPDAVIETWNPAAQRLYGYSEEEAIGQRGPTLLASDPASREPLLARVLAGSDIEQFDAWDVGKDGGVIAVSVTYSPIRDREGRVVGIARIANDITRRKAAEREHARLASIVESSGDAIISLSTDGRIETWNTGAELLYGYSAEEAVGQHAPTLLSRDADERERLLARVSSGVVQAVELTALRKDRVVVDVSVTGSPIRDLEGQVTGVSVIVRDVGERHAAQRREREAMARQMLRLTSKYDVILHTDEAMDQDERQRRATVAEEAVDLEYLRERIPSAFGRTVDGVARVTSIVQAMKRFSRSASSKPAPADLNEAISTTLTVCRNEYKYVADVELELGSLPAVVCNIGELNQVFLNLIINAAQAIEDKVAGTAQRGTIRITTRLDGTEAVITVSDSGCGIPEPIRQRIFDPFFTTKDVGRGSGQGLPLARSTVVNQHGGTIDVDSVAGAGATFHSPGPGRAGWPTGEGGQALQR